MTSHQSFKNLSLNEATKNDYGGRKNYEKKKLFSAFVVIINLKDLPGTTSTLSSWIQVVGFSTN